MKSEFQLQRPMVAFEDIAAFVRDQTAYQGSITEATSLQDDIGLYGDDLNEFMWAYTEQFHVDLSNYLWYFHTGEEGVSFGGTLARLEDGNRVKEIPITLKLLHKFAQHGVWAIAYPPHTIPRYRPDIWLNRAILVGFCTLLIRSCWSN